MSPASRTFPGAHRADRILFSISVLGAVVMALPSSAQSRNNASGRTTRTYGMRVEASGYVRWMRSALDPSGGAKTYWLHISAAHANGRTTGGFNLDMPSRIMANATNMVSSPPPSPAAAKNPATLPPITSKLSGKCTMAGKNYRFEIDLVGNKWNPPTKPGARGRSTPGTIKVRIYDASAKSRQAPVLESQAVERSWVQFNDRRNVPATSSGGAMAPTGVFPKP